MFDKSIFENRRELGAAGEKLAAEYLGKNGYLVLERNVKTLLGEIDIVARKEKTIAIIEVKSKIVDRFEHPDFAAEKNVDERKKRKLLQLGRLYLANSQKYKNWPWEIDVIAVEFNRFRRVEIRFWRQVVSDNLT